MARLNPDKVHVEYRDVTPTEPVLGRRYTQTHVDVTAELFVTVGLNYANDKINPLRDEVLAEWLCAKHGEIYLWAYVYVGGFDLDISRIRYNIFIKELPLALAAIREADDKFFNNHPELDQAPIYVFFDSPYPDLRGQKYYQTPAVYKNYYRRKT